MHSIDLTTRGNEARDRRGGGDLPTSPGVPAVVVTCIDARVDPAHLFDLEPGEASVFRNIGGRLTDDTIGQIGILAGLAKAIAGDEVELDVAIVHHSECGASQFSVPPVQEMAAATANVDPSTVAALAIDDPERTVHVDIRRLADAGLPRGLRISGYVYDVATGGLVEVEETQTLGSVGAR